MSKALIVSVGGSPEPVITAIVHHKPAFVCFFASQQSVDSIGQIKQSVPGKWSEARYDDHKVIVDDPEEIEVCYKKALECFDEVEKRGFGSDQRVADVTGGTKAMTAALAIALAVRGGSFSYVGGQRRDKEGLGVAVTGYERMREAVNPLRRYAVEQKRRAAQYFNEHRYNAAAAVLAALPAETGQREAQALTAVRKAAEAYALWDHFHHQEAVEKLKPAKETLAQLGIAQSGEPRFKWLSRFADDVANNLRELQRLQCQTRNFQDLQPALAADLAAGAKRRIESGAFDDAVARLYRAIEMLGQCEFERVFKMMTSEVEPERIPEPLQEDYTRRYADENSGRLKLPLYAVFRALEAADAELGRRFAQDRERLKALLAARNDSLLAHGSTPVKEATARQMLDLVRQWLPQDAALVEFPRLELG
jgi:CRISPR-associated protein (TIGR02710 family)